MSQWKLVDFDCPAHGKFEELCDRRKGIPDRLCCPYRYDFEVSPPDSNQCRIMGQRVTT